MYTKCTALPKQLQVYGVRCRGEREVIKRPCDEAMMLLLRPLAAVLLCTLKFLLHFLERVEGWRWGRRTAQRQRRGPQVEVVLEDQIKRHLHL